MARTIFERYGGFAKINRIVTAFYDKMLESPVTAPYFAHTDMRMLIDHQTKFVATVTGGPASYDDEVLEKVHARLGITEEAFLEAVSLLKETLQEFGLAEGDVSTVIAEIVRRKNFIVARR